MDYNAEVRKMDSLVNSIGDTALRETAQSILLTMEKASGTICRVAPSAREAEATAMASLERAKITQTIVESLKDGEKDPALCEVWFCISERLTREAISLTRHAHRLSGIVHEAKDDFYHHMRQIESLLKRDRTGQQ